MFLQNLTSSNPQVANLVNMARNSGNPMGYLNEYAKTNPAMAQAINVAKGKTPQEIQNFIQNIANQYVK